MNLEKLREEVLLTISSLLCANKGAVTPEILNGKTDCTSILCYSSLYSHLLVYLAADYYSVLHKSIPHRLFGFQNLWDFLQSVPQIVQCTNAYGMLLIEAVPQKRSAHIFQLVQGQKKARSYLAKFYIDQNQRTEWSHPEVLRQHLPPQICVTVNSTRMPAYQTSPNTERQVCFLSPNTNMGQYVPTARSSPTK